MVVSWREGKVTVAGALRLDEGDKALYKFTLRYFPFTIATVNVPMHCKVMPMGMTSLSPPQHYWTGKFFCIATFSAFPNSSLSTAASRPGLHPKRHSVSPSYDSWWHLDDLKSAAFVGRNFPGDWSSSYGRAVPSSPPPCRNTTKPPPLLVSWRNSLGHRPPIGSAQR